MNKLTPWILLGMLLCMLWIGNGLNNIGKKGRYQPFLKERLSITETYLLDTWTGTYRDVHSGDTWTFKKY